MRKSRRALAMAALLSLCLAAGLAHWVARTALPPLDPPISAQILDRNGQLLRVFAVEDGRIRLGADLDDIDPRFIDALIAYEDKRFYAHSGVDPRALLRAAWDSARHGKIRSGGSTLTMQLARLLERSGTGHWRGKLRQIRLALALEQHLSKDQILRLYLTLAPYGGNLEGVRAASLSYFGKAPARLTEAQIAMLIALPQAPEARRPDRSPKAAAQARDRVLARLAREWPDPQALHAAQRDPAPTMRRPLPFYAPHLTTRAKAEGIGRVTLDRALQARLEQLALDAVPRLPAGVSLAMLVADIDSGEIRAAIGSPHYSSAGGRSGFIDMTRALRSPGSTLKPLLYGLGFADGVIAPQTRLRDMPTAHGSYRPQNFDLRYEGMLRAAEALRRSRNIPAVMLAEALGPVRLFAAMRAAGMSPRLDGRPGLALALGGVGVRLEGLVSLYMQLARGARAGPALHWHKEAPAPMLPALLTDRAARQLGAVLARMTPPPGQPDLGIAYKTGTSYGHRDGWALGYDRRHVAGVWIGRPDGTPVPGIYGADLAAPLLFELFQRLGTPIVPLLPMPPPLAVAKARPAVFAQDTPVIAFPPEGAELQPDPDGLPVRILHGQPPFRWLINGIPTEADGTGRTARLPLPGAGFSQVTVIDAQGQAARRQIRILEVQAADPTPISALRPAPP